MKVLRQNEGGREEEWKGTGWKSGVKKEVGGKEEGKGRLSERQQKIRLKGNVYQIIIKKTSDAKKRQLT